MAAAELVRAALQGDQNAWDELVDSYAGLVWSVIRGFRLGPADAQDAFQATWLRLVEHLGDLRNPDAVGGWLATTARHECLATIRRSGRTVVTDTDHLERDLERQVGEPQPLDAGLLTSERDRALWRAFSRLGERCQALLRVLLADPPLSYAEVGAAMDMPVGSIGPTRGRCLARLREAIGGDSAISGG